MEHLGIGWKKWRFTYLLIFGLLMLIDLVFGAFGHQTVFVSFDPPFAAFRNELPQLFLPTLKRKSSTWMVPPRSLPITSGVKEPKSSPPRSIGARKVSASARRFGPVGIRIHGLNASMGYKNPRYKWGKNWGEKVLWSSPFTILPGWVQVGTD